MKITYTFADGETSIFEVDEAIGAVMLDLDRQENNVNHRETRRHDSLEAYNLDHALIPSTTDVAAEVERNEFNAEIIRAIANGTRF